MYLILLFLIMYNKKNKYELREYVKLQNVKIVEMAI